MSKFIVVKEFIGQFAYHTRFINFFVAVRSLNRIIEWRGKPQIIRVDNGPEYISGKLMAWAAKMGIHIQYIQPGKPQQNAYIERYNRTVRQEWLGQNILETIEEAQKQATQWLVL